MFAVSNIAGILNIRDIDFITADKNYLETNEEKVSVDNFLKYEKMDSIDYILPGDSTVSFKIKFDEYYQTAIYTADFKGSLLTNEILKEEDIVLGRMPQNDYEIVLDKMVFENMAGNSALSNYTTSSLVKLMGLKGAEDLLGRKTFVDNMKEFTIVGFG